MQIMTDPDPGAPKTYGSESTTLFFSLRGGGVWVTDTCNLYNFLQERVDEIADEARIVSDRIDELRSALGSAR